MQYGEFGRWSPVRVKVCLTVNSLNNTVHTFVLDAQVAEWLARQSLTNAARVQFPAGDLIPVHKWEGLCSCLSYLLSLGGDVKPLA